MEFHQLLNSNDTAAASCMAAPDDDARSSAGRGLRRGHVAAEPRCPVRDRGDAEPAAAVRAALRGEDAGRPGRFPAAGNPFLWQIFAGDFPPGQPYDWLHPGWPEGTLVTPCSTAARMRDVLEDRPAGSTDFVHLSNILDWLRPAEAEATLRSVRRALRPGGMVLLRQLNSTLDPASLECGIAWDREWGQAMEQRDRSFFYPAIHAGRAV